MVGCAGHAADGHTLARQPSPNSHLGGSQRFSGANLGVGVAVSYGAFSGRSGVQCAAPSCQRTTADTPSFCSLLCQGSGPEC
jgi:hypothetical protein